MSDLSLFDLVAAWEMLVDRHLASADWLAESRFLFRNDLESVTYRNLLLAMVKPPLGTSREIAEKLRARNLQEVECVDRQSRGLSRKQFMELLALANGKSLELGRDFPGFLRNMASGPDAVPPGLAEPADVGAGALRPTVPVPPPDEALLERCRHSDPPTIMPPPAYPEVVGQEVGLVPSRRYPSEPPNIPIGAEEMEIDGLEDKS